jgi:hypothetical protein
VPVLVSVSQSTRASATAYGIITVEHPFSSRSVLREKEKPDGY